MVLQRRSLLSFVLVLILASSLSACNLLPGVNISLSGSSTSSLSDPSPNTWTTVSPGIEVRSEKWSSPGDNTDTVIITRVDPARVQLQIGYQPTNPMTMSQWQKSTDAKVLMNGGYFDSNNQPEGLLVSNGQTFGTSYQGFGGMLSVDQQGNTSLRSLSEQPYDPDTDQLTQATQSSPMLMINGKRTQFDANAASQRRSIVATDMQGRLLFIASPDASFSLDEIADLLASSDLSIKDALNLDGGASTGLYVSDGTHQKAAVDSATPLPIVIIVK
jgi:uncharacterized protein YigE (DUF2233 family)